MSYDQNQTDLSAASGQPNATDAAASSIATTTYPYRRRADRAVSTPILLRPPSADDSQSTDPTIAAIEALQSTMEQVARSTRLVSAPWLIEPPDAESFHLGGGLIVPAADGNYHAVVTITCPPGRNGVLNRIANVVVGGAWSDFSGDAIWRLIKNPGAAVSSGVWTPSNAFAERNYQTILASYGLVNAPAKISPIRIFENDVIVLAIQNVNLPVSGEECGALLGGFFYPRTWDDQYDARDKQNAW